MDTLDQALWLERCISDDNVIPGDQALQNEVRQLMHTSNNPTSTEKTLQRSSREQSSKLSQHPRNTFSQEQVKILRSWLKAHINYPYPGTEDVVHLSDLTSLSQEQISRWFTNQRARQGSSKAMSITSRPSEQVAMFDTLSGPSPVTEALIGRRETSLARSTRSPSTFQSFPGPANIRPERLNQLERRTPLEDYLASPTEAGPINESVIRHASNSPDYQATTNAMTRSLSHQSSSQMSLTQPSSYLGFEFNSHFFQPSATASVEGPRKQGRKRDIWRTAPTIDGRNRKRGKVQPTSAPSELGEVGEPVFFCTFTGCHKELTSKTWKRHEETKHVQRLQWICLRNGFRVQSNLADTSECAFCGLLDPDDTHGATCSRITDCLHRKESDRTYSRKDHLKQHIKNFHGSTFKDSMESWREEKNPDEGSWSCGFCGEVLSGWDARALHVSQHFRKGAHIREWNPDLTHHITLPPAPSFGQHITYPYPAPTDTIPTHNTKGPRPDLCLDIPDMTNPQSPSPVDCFDVITPTDPTTINATPQRYGSHRMLLHSPRFNNSLQASPTSNQRQWASPSPSTPLITFTSDDPSAYKPFPPGMNLNAEPTPDQSSVALLVQRVGALEAEVHQLRSSHGQQAEREGSREQQTASPQDRRLLSPMINDRSIEQQKMAPYRCCDPGCPSVTGFRHPHQPTQHERRHHDGRFQRMIRRPSAPDGSA